MKEINILNIIYIITIMNNMKIMNIMDIMNGMIIFNIINIINIMDNMNRVNTTAWMAMAGAVSAFVLICFSTTRSPGSFLKLKYFLKILPTSNWIFLVKLEFGCKL